MHKLDRTCTIAPGCLHHYRHGMHSWEHMRPAERQEIRDALEAMQGRRCAYCECDLESHGEHIEHFHQRNRYPQGTFEWDNLFWSCGRNESCGKHKDSCGVYHPTDLIKPDDDDPEHFLQFVSNGSIAVRSSLSSAEQHRAIETLRIFNLDAERGQLRQMRQNAIRGYIQTLDELREYRACFTPEEIAEYIASELAYTRDQPFCTAIKHFLEL